MPKTKLTAFALRLALFLTPLLAFCIAVYVAFAKFPMYYFDHEYVLYQHQKNYIFENDDYNRVIISGDSKPQCAFLPSLLSDDTYNLSLIGVTPLENYYYLKEYLENHMSPETVFISFTPYHFMRFDSFWQRSVYFHRLSDKDLDEIYNIASECNDAGDIINDFDRELKLYNYYSAKKYGKALIKSLFENRRTENLKMYQSLYDTKGQSYIGKADYSDALNFEVDYVDFEPYDVLDYYFRKTINLCLEYNTNVIVINIPMNKATYDACNESYLTDYDNYMNNIQMEYPQITVDMDLNYWDNEYFGDFAHFNKKGAEKFTKYIKEKYTGCFAS